MREAGSGTGGFLLNQYEVDRWQGGCFLQVLFMICKNVRNLPQIPATNPEIRALRGRCGWRKEHER
jgi:hypothetical protein